MPGSFYLLCLLASSRQYLTLPKASYPLIQTVCNNLRAPSSNIRPHLETVIIPALASLRRRHPFQLKMFVPEDVATHLGFPEVLDWGDITATAEALQRLRSEYELPFFLAVP